MKLPDTQNHNAVTTTATTTDHESVALTKRLSKWRNGRIKKDFTLAVVSKGVTRGLDTPAERQSLPQGWHIDDNGYFTCHFPSVDIEKTDFVAGELEAYPAYLQTARFTKGTSDSRFLMDAGHVALGFHHWMGHHVPNFWDVYHYEQQEHRDKVFRLVFEGQGEIVFHGTHGGYWGEHSKTDEQGAKLVVKSGEETYRLLYESHCANPHRDVCYPGQRDMAMTAFNLPPKGPLADNIITAFAIIHAVGRHSRENNLKALPAGHQATTGTSPKPL